MAPSPICLNPALYVLCLAAHDDDGFDAALVCLLHHVGDRKLVPVVGVPMFALPQELKALILLPEIETQFFPGLFFIPVVVGGGGDVRRAGLGVGARMRLLG